MADLSDVESGIVREVIGALYPNGPSQASAVGAACRVYRGWPSPATLNSDLAGGIVNVTIVPATTADEVLDVYFDRPDTIMPSAGVSAMVVGNTVAFSGPVAGCQ